MYLYVLNQIRSVGNMVLLFFRLLILGKIGQPNFSLSTSALRSDCITPASSSQSRGASRLQPTHINNQPQALAWANQMSIPREPYPSRGSGFARLMRVSCPTINSRASHATAGTSSIPCPTDPGSPISRPLISPSSPFPLPIPTRIFTAGLRRSLPVLHLTAGAPFLRQVPPSFSSSFESVASFCILFKKHASRYLMIRPTSSSTESNY